MRSDTEGPGTTPRVQAVTAGKPGGVVDLHIEAG
jgi:hypothetical protein